MIIEMDEEKILRKYKNKKSNLFFATTAQRFMMPYIPASNAISMSRNITITADDNLGHVTYNAPYAHYQYVGILYVSPTTGSAWASAGETKVPTGIPLNYDKNQHPMATSYWDKAMMRTRKKDLAKTMQTYFKKV